jgi:hypothetical protein
MEVGGNTTNCVSVLCKLTDSHHMAAVVLRGAAPPRAERKPRLRSLSPFTANRMMDIYYLFAGKVPKFQMVGINLYGTVFTKEIRCLSGFLFSFYTVDSNKFVAGARL